MSNSFCLLSVHPKSTVLRGLHSDTFPSPNHDRPCSPSSSPDGKQSDSWQHSLGIASLQFCKHGAVACEEKGGHLQKSSGSPCLSCRARALTGASQRGFSFVGRRRRRAAEHTALELATSKQVPGPLVRSAPHTRPSKTSYLSAGPGSCRLCSRSCATISKTWSAPHPTCRT